MLGGSRAVCMRETTSTSESPALTGPWELWGGRADREAHLERFEPSALCRGRAVEAFEGAVRVIVGAHM